MRILHTESSNGWGGQEIRILREAEGMRANGHEVIFAVVNEGKLAEQAREKGFTVYECSFKKSRALTTVFFLVRLIKKHLIDLVNTHSSMDAWLGGVAARIAGAKIIRTRHLSTSIRAGINSRLLYNKLADFVVTTSSSIISPICAQSGLPPEDCTCIPTGVDPLQIKADQSAVQKFRAAVGAGPEDVLVGTACFVRSWKGIKDFMRAAALLKSLPGLKWVIVGGGYVNDYKGIAEELGITEVLTFTGHLDNPFDAIAGFDIFALLSTAHEGISQASLQAAYLERPLITTPIGGLPEVCLDGETGLVVPPFAPQSVADAVMKLREDKELRMSMGHRGKQLVESKFLFKHTIERMEQVYSQLRDNR